MFRLLKNKEFITSIIINSGLTYYSDCIIGRKRINYDYLLTDKINNKKDKGVLNDIDVLTPISHSMDNTHTSNTEIYYEFDKYKIIPIFGLSLTFGYISIPAFLTTMYIQK